MDQETEENDNSTSSLDKNSFTGSPNKGQGLEERNLLCQSQIFKQK